MRHHIPLILAVLLVSAHCTTISDKYPALKQRKSLLAMMTSIESKVVAKTPAHEIVKLVTDYTNAIQEEQLNQHSLFEKQTKECDDEIHFRENEIKSATDATNKAKFALDACTAQHNRADSDLTIVNNQISETVNYLTQLIATREQEAQDFQAATENYSFNASAADEAIDILQEIWSGEATFLQLAKHANKMLVHAIQIRKVHKLTPVMSALAQLASKKLIADEALITNVMNLLRDFRQNIESDYRGLEASEQASIELYNTNRARTEDFLASLKLSKHDLEIEVSKLNQCINNQSAILTTAQAKLNRNAQLLEAAKNMCASFQREYDAATTARNQELELIEIIKQKLEARYGQVSDLVKKRAFEDNFDDHQSTQYQNEDYQPRRKQGQIEYEYEI